MNVRFTKQQLEDWYTGNFTGKQPFNSEVLKQYRKVVNQLSAASNLATLRTIKGLNLHELKRDLAGKYAVRVNKQYELISSTELCSRGRKMVASKLLTLTI